ncbi:uncharacterized protein K452DRAFT_317463 [Aplosporella prunicola CBS 121167]|uniref:Uncharacterized protein n=1 Tax=Aplosporella prunicola CBS 121167 TaxID=1176127 RepID=A0A6A6BGK2_9PEZI|nr:uncharacterized protein K452DRAFT_317463 [Aplosporella prunicola CBS 121167]KAF2143290.1 hypothetical protein K452DRAFT_317463 [Aplosporella prunicola CBS 121167]
MPPPFASERLRRLLSQISWDRQFVLDWLKSSKVAPHLKEFAELFSASEERCQTFEQKLAKYASEAHEGHEDPIAHLVWKLKYAVQKQYKNKALKDGFLGAKSNELQHLNWKDILSRSAMMLVHHGQRAVDSPFKGLGPAGRDWCFEVAITTLITVHEDLQREDSHFFSDLFSKIPHVEGVADVTEAGAAQENGSEAQQTVSEPSATHDNRPHYDGYTVPPAVSLMGIDGEGASHDAPASESLSTMTSGRYPQIVNLTSSPLSQGNTGDTTNIATRKHNHLLQDDTMIITTREHDQLLQDKHELLRAKIQLRQRLEQQQTTIEQLQQQSQHEEAEHEEKLLQTVDQYNKVIRKINEENKQYKEKASKYNAIARMVNSSG